LKAAVLSGTHVFRISYHLLYFQTKELFLRAIIALQYVGETLANKQNESNHQKKDFICLLVFFVETVSLLLSQTHCYLGPLKHFIQFVDFSIYLEKG